MNERERRLLCGLPVIAAGFAHKTLAGLPAVPADPGTFTLLYCSRGGGWCAAKERVYPVRAGQVLFLWPSAHHRFGTERAEP